MNDINIKNNKINNMHKEPILGDTTTNDLLKHNMLPVVQELITRLQKNPILYDMLEKSIKMASSKINFEEKNKVKNINEYILFINNYVLHTPDQLTNSDTVSKQDMLDGICYFYFLIDQPLEDLKNLGLFKNSIQYYPIFQEWLLQYVVAIGEYLDTDKSWNNIYYNKILNKIELLYDKEDPTAAIYFNVPAGAMISKGFSTDLTYKLHPRLTLNTGVFHNELSSIINTSEFTSNTDYASNLKYKNVKYRFELSLFYKYTDRYTRYVGSMDMETGEIYDVSLNYLDSYHNMDATISIPILKDAVRLTTGVKNIFNNKSITSSGGGAVHSGGSGGNTLLNWGRTFFLKASYQFINFKKQGP